MEPGTIYDYSQSEHLLFEERQPTPYSIIFLLPFILSAVSLTFVEGLNLIVIGLGVLAFFAFLFYTLKAGFLLPLELKCFLGYFLIATLGIFVIINPQIFFMKYRTMVQILLMTVMVMNYARSTGSVKLILLTVFFGSLVVGASAVWSGDYMRAEYEGERAAGFAANANAFAINLTFATMISLYFFKVWKSWILKIGLVGMVLVFGRLILASGSRTGFYGFLLTLVLWFIFSYAILLKKHPGAFFVGFFFVAVVCIVFYIASKGTVVEERLKGSVQEDIRYSMYIYGIKLIFSNPILGVGLDHFIVYTPFATYSHSNYIEVFSNTGIIGGISYYLIYPILFLRLRRIGKYPLSKDAWELVAMGKMYVILRYALDFVSVPYFDKLNWIFFAILIGWSYCLERQLLAQQQTQYFNSPTEEQPDSAYEYAEDINRAQASCE
jgi:O-antigen ligase